MSTFDDLLAHAQRLLDQRQDPFDDAVFCERLMECPEAMEEVVRLRAALLQVEQSPVQARRRPILWWTSGAAAAALLMLMLPQPEPKLEISDVGSPSMTLPTSLPIPAKSTAINFRIQVQSVHLNPNPGSKQFRVAVVTTRIPS